MSSLTIAVTALILLAVLTLLPLLRLLKGDSRGEVGLIGRWGGFGGGRGGWQLTRGLTLLLLTVFFGAALAGISAYLIRLDHEEKTQAANRASSEDRVKLLQEHIALLEKMLTQAQSANTSCLQLTQVPAPEKSAAPPLKSTQPPPKPKVANPCEVLQGPAK